VPTKSGGGLPFWPQDHSWRATMNFDGETFVAPWSVQRKGGLRLAVVIKVASASSAPCPSPLSSAPSDVDASKEVISENAMRNIFTWLRPNGWSRHEGSIWGHAWFADLDSDSESDHEDEAEAEESGPVTADKSSTTALWIMGTQSCLVPSVTP
jgi:hypothetical protein